MKTVKNKAASIRQLLYNRAQAEKRPFDELLQYYAMERFLYRLSRSPHADKFVLKGALMLRVWESPELRPTRDIDMLGRTSNLESDVVGQVKDIIAVKVEDDGLVFDADSIEVEQITEDADYTGIRVVFRGRLGTARIHMQFDAGFGDIVYPKPEIMCYPTIFDSPAPSLLCYSRESAIAEKLEAMVKLGELNSRMKDFFDIWLMSRQSYFVGEDLAEAIRLTFEQRGTAIPEKIPAFNISFAEDKQQQWDSFRKKLQQDHIPASFDEIISALGEFATPIVSAICSGSRIPSHWKAPGGWK